MFLCTGDQKFVKEVKKIIPDEEITVINDAVLITDKGIKSGKEMVVIDLEPGFKDMKVFPEKMPVMTCPCIALSNVPTYEEAVRLMQYGIRGYGNKYMLPENFRQTISAVSAGQLWLIPSILNQFIQNMAQPDPKPVSEAKAFWEKISKREKEVALFIAKGLANQEIADTMFVSLRTVKAHLTNIYAKTGCRDRMELALKVNQVKPPSD
ncbi:MAG: response regulator transcription factor [Desulfobacterales bacterium]|nr:response regulator transcription factor [Desulfobacterales bacterium]